MLQHSVQPDAFAGIQPWSRGDNYPVRVVGVGDRWLAALGDHESRLFDKVNTAERVASATKAALDISGRPAAYAVLAAF